MGWTGIFNWDRSETNQQILERELFGYGEKRTEPVKWSAKGSHVWCLYRDKETNKHYAMVVLCDRKKGDPEFCYKEIGLSMGPCETDMPRSWLKLIDKDYFTDEQPSAKKWLEDFENQSKTKKETFDFGDIVKCTNGNGTIGWGNGHKIEPNAEFYVKVKVLNPFAKKRTKMYQIVEKDLNGNFREKNYRINSNTFKYIEKELVK